MKVTFDKCEVKGERLLLIARIVADLEALEQKEDYQHRQMSEKVVDMIAEKVATEFLKEKQMDILSGMDINKIINAAQLKVAAGAVTRDV